MKIDELRTILNRHAAWLRGESGGERADLTRANLTRANLTRANLTGANLNRANLVEADLTRASLTGASLTGASLTGADLNEASLTGADLYGANLRGVNLWNCAGNGREIRTMQPGRYVVTVCGEVVQIGCKRYSIREWETFDDTTIEQMDEGALDWWRQHKELVLMFARAVGAQS